MLLQDNFSALNFVKNIAVSFWMKPSFSVEQHPGAEAKWCNLQPTWQERQPFYQCLPEINITFCELAMHLGIGVCALVSVHCS